MLVGSELIQQTNEKVKKIQERLKTSLNKQISYAKKRRRPLEFSARDISFLELHCSLVLEEHSNPRNKLLSS